ncbi:hypothetical protein F4678DRAFT_464538 [Xylaria arbuscula]|nr:hypothetical protein F4678DRAFT_464538 [Xylaria arbuscula]
MESSQLDEEAARDPADKGFTPVYLSLLSLEYINRVSGKGKIFSSYQWSYFSSYQQGPLRSRAESFLELVDWVALKEYAATKLADKEDYVAVVAREEKNHPDGEKTHRLADTLSYSQFIALEY